MMKLFFSSLILILVLAFSPAQTFAADVRANETISMPVTEKNLHDLYLFGQTISVDAPVTNDLVIAGGNILVANAVSGDLLVAGGNVQIKGPVTDTARIAGGTINIDNMVGRDLVVAGGNVTTGQNASVAGDILMAGGKLHITGPVKGKIQLSGGEAIIDAPVTGDITGRVNKLTLGSHASISGNLTYSSPAQVTIEHGASVSGRTTFNRVQEKHNRAGAAAFFGSLTIYKLLTDILLSILFIYFFKRFLLRTLNRMGEEPVKNGAIGFIFFLLFPITAAICLILIWLGLAGFLFYGLMLLVTIFLVKIFLGWSIMRWYEMRSKEAYLLDWRAGVIGPIVLFIVFLVPFVGWLAAAILFFIALGSILFEIQDALSGQTGTKTSKKVQMIITKFIHSCLLVEEANKTFLIDPGNFSVQENALTLDRMNTLDYILITHEHPDHMYVPFIKDAAAKFPDVKIFAPASAVALLKKENLIAASEGNDDVALSPVPHEKLWDKEPPQNNLVSILHTFASPGDSHHFTTDVKILALPIQAPWGSTSDAVQLGLQLKPKVIIPIHDWMWRDDFRQMMYQRLADFFARQGINFKSPETGVPMQI